MTWTRVYCPYEGGGYGDPVKILINETDFDTIYETIQEKKDQINNFVEHSVDEDYTQPVMPSDQRKISELGIRNFIADPFTANYAILDDGTVIQMKHYGTVVEVE